MNDRAVIGSNSIDPALLTSYIDRIENLESAKADILEDISEVLKEAKDKKFDIKTIKRILKERAKPPEQRVMEREMLEAYLHALGMM